MSFAPRHPAPTAPVTVNVSGLGQGRSYYVRFTRIGSCPGGGRTASIGQTIAKPPDLKGNIRFDPFDPAQFAGGPWCRRHGYRVQLFPLFGNRASASRTMHTGG
jgi:hypothetical protein